jgi:hypothetical protein
MADLDAQIEKLSAAIAGLESQRKGLGDAVVDPAIATSQAYFVVRAARPGRDTKMVLALSTTTWCAYNDWGGPNLYMAAPLVSFDRPLPKGFLDRPAAPNDRLANVTMPGDPDMTAWLQYFVAHGVDPWCGAAGWFNWERRFVAWAEGAGHRLDYLTSIDLHGRTCSIRIACT